MGRFFVVAKSVNQVKRALIHTAGGVRVIGRFDRETIECSHTMESQSFKKNWPIILSRLSSAGLQLVDRPGSPGDTARPDGGPGRHDDCPDVEDSTG
ncbi:hypothetical protein EP7_001369 [Isosphaeraceae bacterium EP7]